MEDSRRPYKQLTQNYSSTSGNNNKPKITELCQKTKIDKINNIQKKHTRSTNTTALDDFFQ